MNRFVADSIDVSEDVFTPTIDLQTRHVSVRSFDTTRPVTEEALTAIITAAQSASTSSNFQAWSVIQVSDPSRRAQLRKLCNDQVFVEEAPVFLVFCPDTYRLRWLTERQGYKFEANYIELLIMAVMDAALACQNAVLAAESLGLGCCMVGAIRDYPSEVSALLELPRGVFASVGVAMGYPVEDERNPVKPRLPHCAVLHRDVYDITNLESALPKYDERMAATSIYENRRVHIPGVTPEPSEDVDHYGWLEHTARRMARPNKRRLVLANFLREQGFSLD